MSVSKRQIVLEVSHPERPPGKVVGFRFVWAFQVHGFRPDRHCQRCFRGRRVESFCTRTAQSGKSVEIDLDERTLFLYVCGVGKGPKVDLHKQNFHLPLRYAEGQVVTKTIQNDYLVTARNAVALPIPALPPGWNGLDDEMTGCKNFRFGVAAFGYPTIGLENY